MLSNLVVLGGLALASAQSVSLAQGYAPAPSTLSATQSGVLPIAPTPFPGVQTVEGAITYDGPVLPGFIGPGGNAVAQTGMPNTSYVASLPAQQFDPYVGSTITGVVTGSRAPNGTGVSFTVVLAGLPSEAQYGPFVYHIHNLPLTPDGNCTASMGHLDPTNRGELHACDTANPQTCQAGDLAGKHGNVTTMSFMASFVDPYLTTTPGSPYFFGDKSIVIHSANTTRLTCANFTMLPSTSSSAAPSATKPAASSYTGAGFKVDPFTGAVGGLAIVLLSAVFLL